MTTSGQAAAADTMSSRKPTLDVSIQWTSSRTTTRGPSVSSRRSACRPCRPRRGSPLSRPDRPGRARPPPPSHRTRPPGPWPRSRRHSDGPAPGRPRARTGAGGRSSRNRRRARRRRPARTCARSGMAHHRRRTRFPSRSRRSRDRAPRPRARRRVATCPSRVAGQQDDRAATRPPRPPQDLSDTGGLVPPPDERVLDRRADGPAATTARARRSARRDARPTTGRATRPNRGRPPRGDRDRHGPSPRRAGSRPGRASDWMRAAVVIASPVTDRSPLPSPRDAATTSPVASPIRTSSGSPPSSGSRSDARMASAASAARTGSSSCARGQPKTANTASPMNFSRVPSRRSMASAIPRRAVPTRARTSSGSCSAIIRT